MTTESVDIQVQGTVKPKIETDLRGIAKAATEGYSALERLQKMLNQLDGGGLSGMTAQIEKQTRALNDAAASSRIQASNLRVLQQQLDRTNTSQKVAATTAQNSKDRILELARAGVAEAQAQRDRTNALFEAARATDSATQSVRRQVAVTQEQIQAAQAATRAARDQINATRQQAAAEEQLQTTQQRTTAGWRDYNTGLTKTGQNAQLARHHLLNLGFQLQDIGVSLASGQNPLTVAVQQGAQIQGIAQQAGVGLRGLAAAIGALLLPMLPFAAAIGAIVAGLKIMSVELSKSNNLTAYSKSLGLTSQQIKKLDGDVVTITDTFKGFFTTVSEATGAGKAWDSFIASATKAFKNIVGYAVNAFNFIGAAQDGTVAVLVSGWEQMSPKVREIIGRMVNSLVNIFETGFNLIIRGVNQVISALNAISMIKIDPFKEMELPRIDMPKEQKQFEQAGDVFAAAFTEGFKNRSAEFDKFYADWQANSVKAAKARIKEGADKYSTGNAEESRAAAMAKINAQLDNEISRMQMLKPIREQQQRFDQIEEQLIGRKITLNAAEAASLREKIAQIAEARDIQQQADRIYEETRKASEDYNASLAAAQQLLEQGAISQEVYNAQTNAAQEAYDNASDPLRKYRMELEFQIETMGKSSDELAILTMRRQIEQEALRNGVSLREQDVAALMKQAEAAQYAQGVQQQYNQIYTQTAGAIEQLAQKQAALQMAYANGLIGQAAFNAGMVQSQIEAAKLRVAMDQAIPGDAMLASMSQVLEGYQGMAAGAVNALGEMFNTLADGFANALAGAIMGTESLGEALRNVAQQAVQQLIASLIKLGIQWAINAALSQTLGAAVTAGTVTMAGTAATAWAPAAALASLASFGANAGPATAGMGATMVAAKSFAMLGSVGFQQGGYTGNGGVSEVAGVVHGQEYVMRADTVSRLGVDTLDAIQNGRPLSATASSAMAVQSGGNVGTGSVSVTVINNADGTTATTTQTDDGQGNQDITVTIDSIENALASRIDSGQGPLSRSVQKNFNVQHQTVRR